MGFGIIFVNKDFLGFKIDSSKIYDNIDVVRVANEMKSCDVKNLSSAASIKVVHLNCTTSDHSPLWIVPSGIDPPPPQVQGHSASKKCGC